MGFVRFECRTSDRPVDVLFCDWWRLTFRSWRSEIARGNARALAAMSKEIEEQEMEL